MVEGSAGVVDPGDDDAGEEGAVRRRLGTAAHPVAVVVNELEGLSHRILVGASVHAPVAIIVSRCAAREAAPTNGAARWSSGKGVAASARRALAG
jgi:hypothetical protein